MRNTQQADEVVDPKPKVDASCHKSCTREFSEYEKCKERIKAKGTGVCEAWHFDYQKCIDACVRGRGPRGNGASLPLVPPRRFK